MIGAADVRELARALSLRDTVVEKDYVLGWLLWGLAAEPALGPSWAFKGGTCLRKCYFAEYRFSEDLDFTITSPASFSVTDLREQLAAAARRVYEASGIEVPLDLIRVQSYVTRRGTPATEVRLSYRGPLSARGDLPRVRLDLTPGRSGGAPTDSATGLPSVPGPPPRRGPGPVVLARRDPRGEAARAG